MLPDYSPILGLKFGRLLNVHGILSLLIGGLTTRKSL